MFSFIEEKDGDEIIYKLLVDNLIVASAKTLSYSFLMNIYTTQSEKRNGYGKQLLNHIEAIAKNHNVNTMETTDIDSKSLEAVAFFTSMNYELIPIKDDVQFLEGTKNLKEIK